MTEPLWLFGFTPKEMPEHAKRAPKRVRTCRAELSKNTLLQRDLMEWNGEMGLYFTVNSGGTKKDEISRINAVFCEIDDRPIEDQHDAYDLAWYPPSIRVVTRKSVHAYWLLEHPISPAEFEEVQQGLIATFKADKALTNTNRVMRLPFFNHVAWENGRFEHTPVTWHTFRPDRRFSLAELREAYCPKKEPVPVPKFETSIETEWDSVFAEMQSRFSTLPGYHVEHGGKQAAARGICHNGETNRTLVMSLETGKIFCRNGCDWDTIRQAFGVSRPEKKEKGRKERRTIERVMRPRPKSSLYDYAVEVNG